MRLRRTRRSGLSLLEVLIALATFLLAVGGLAYLLTVAGNLALDTQWRSQAALLCQSKMAEVAAGAVPLEAQADAPFDEDDTFRWSLEVESAAAQGLNTVTVRVTRKRPDGSQLETALTQMLLDPQMVGSVHDEVGSISGSTDSSSGTTGSGSSSSSSSSASSKTASSGSSSSGSKSSGAAPSGGGRSSGGSSMGGGSMGGGSMGGGSGMSGGGRGGSSGGGSKGP
ncbi:MAG: hypothetical protein U0736_25490 [Gemmataceae bacterium]